MSKWRSFRFMTYGAPVANRITAEGWIVSNVLSLQNTGRGLFHYVSNHFVGIPGTPAEDYCDENDGRETKASLRSLGQLVGLTFNQQVATGLSQS